jgi:phospholipid N-methyltransferase
MLNSFKQIDEFYPTPLYIVNKMLANVNFNKVKTVLEPEAGQGDIAKICRDKMKYIRGTGYNSDKYTPDIDCIEINPQLQAILKADGFRIVHNNFLTYQTCKRYDLIIMNPPFSNGEKHILKALEMQKNGGQIVCLLNADTIKNTYSNTRKDLFQKLQEYNAKIDFIPDAFVDAERKTKVEIALINVIIPAKQQPSYFVEQLKKEQEQYKEESKDSENYEQRSLVKNNLINSIVEQYNLEVKVGIRLIQEYNAMAPMILTSFDKDNYSCKPILKLDFPDTYQYSDHLSINEFVRRVRRKYWTALFTNPQFMELLTQNLCEHYRNKVEELTEYDFSFYNIYTIKQEMTKNMVKGVEDTILSLFEELSYKHSWYDETSKNIRYYNGWKTNKAYIINKRVIIPLSAFSEWSGRINYSYKVKEKLSDIEKVFNYLDTGLTKELDMSSTLKAAEENGETKKITLKYFDVTFYKKGTCHIEFRNLDLLKKFNIFGSQHKCWLPPCYGKVRYTDMTQEEKTVIDEFEGEESYNQTMKNTDYFLFDSSKIPMLTAGEKENA